MEDTKIEWATHTFNGWEGCTMVSPGCANCYAATRNARWNGGTALNWGKGAPRRRTSAANWKLPLKWNREVEAEWENFIAGVSAGADMPWVKRPRVFCSSLADWLDDEVPLEWQTDLLRLIEATPNLDWLLLSKRPENWEGVMTNALLDGVDMVHEWVNGRPPANVWIGTTVEDQQRADERIPFLLEIPARVRFLSCEPLLGPLKIDHIRLADNQWFPMQHLHWVICGGESGPGARPMNPEWARSLRDQCQAAHVPFFFKQWGGVNKKSTGRILDGRTWNELPISSSC